MNADKSPTGDVIITLSYEEAVVLSDLLSRWDRDGTQEQLAFEDQAEERILWDLTAIFEPLIDEALDKDRYARVLAESRWKVRDSTDG
jgi:hypothetical protein